MWFWDHQIFLRSHFVTQPWYVELGFFCLFSCLWRSHFTSPDPSACLFWEQEVYLRTLMVKHTSHVGYMYVALASFPGHVGASVWANLIPIPLGRHVWANLIPIPLGRHVWANLIPIPLGRQVWANLIPIPLGRQCMSQPHSQAMREPGHAGASVWAMWDLRMRLCMHFSKLHWW